MSTDRMSLQENGLEKTGGKNNEIFRCVLSRFCWRRCHTRVGCLFWRLSSIVSHHSRVPKKSPILMQKKPIKKNKRTFLAGSFHIIIRRGMGNARKLQGNKQVDERRKGKKENATSVMSPEAVQVSERERGLGRAPMPVHTHARRRKKGAISFYFSRHIHGACRTHEKKRREKYLAIKSLSLSLSTWDASVPWHPVARSYAVIVRLCAPLLASCPLYSEKCIRCLCAKTLSLFLCLCFALWSPGRPCCIGRLLFIHFPIRRRRCCCCCCCRRRIVES